MLTGTQNVALATANVVREIPIAAPRGDILDRNGNVLATYRIAPEVAIVADDLPPGGPKRRALYRRLAGVLGMSWQNIKATVDNLAVAPPRYAPTAIKDDVGIPALVYLKERARDFPGVVERQVYVRYYPHNDIASVVLGQVGQISGPPTKNAQLNTAAFKGIKPGTYVGQSGLEAEYQRYLQGTAGVQRIDVNAGGFPTGTQPTPTQPVPGDQLKTSLDLGLEEEGYRAVRRAIAAANANGNPAPAGAFLAMDPTTGRVLAIGSDPTYNANEFATGISSSQYNTIKADHSLVDRAIDGQYPTGSTFKPITALGALKAGLITPQTTQGTGSCLTFGTTQRFCNSGQANDGNLDLLGALTQSEDTYFYLVGESANGSNGDGHAIQNEARALGLGSSPGIDLPGGGGAGVRARPGGGSPTSTTRSWPAQCNGHPRRPTDRRSRPARSASTTRPGPSARTSGSRPVRASCTRARCRWPSPTRRSSTAARSGRRRSGRRSTRRRARSCSSCRHRRRTGSTSTRPTRH